MKKFLAVIAAVMFVFLAVIPATCAESAGQKMYIAASNGKTVRVREYPSENGRVLINLGVGRPVTAVGHPNSDWTEVRYQVNGRTRSGYVMSKFLSSTDPATRKQTFRDVKNDFFVKALPATSHNDVCLWNKPSKHSGNKIRSVGSSERMLVVSESNAWYLVSAADGELAYVAKAYVTK